MRHPRDMDATDGEAFFVHAGQRAQGVGFYPQPSIKRRAVYVPRRVECRLRVKDVDFDRYDC